MQIVKNKKLVLASQSPRRKELLEKADLDFEIAIKEVEEIYPADMPVDQIPEYLACLKASVFDAEFLKGKVLITSDTIVVFNGNVLGKPKDRDEAIQFLSMLSNETHTVITGVCIQSSEKKESFIEKSVVKFHPMTEDEIINYVDQYQPFDKAGAYGIQDWIGYVKIEKITGTYANIMGLPIDKVYAVLMGF